MRIFCQCLNISVEVSVERHQLLNDENLTPPNNLNLLENAKCDDFFASQSLNLVSLPTKETETSVIEQIPVLVEKRTVDGWEIRKCKFCCVDLFASNLTTPGRLLFQKSLLKQQVALIDPVANTCQLSPAFQILLPKNEPTDIGDLILKTRKIPEDTASALKEILAAYLKREKESVDEIIRKFAEQQQTALDVLKINAENEYKTLLRVLVKNLETSSEVVVATNVQPVILRPKSNSNPASFGAWKRKRRSGGSQRTSHLEEEENQCLFSMDEQETPNPAATPTEESDPDEGEDYSRYYPPPPADSENDDDDDDDAMTNRVLNQFGTSLPVTIPAGISSRAPTYTRGISEEEDETPLAGGAARKDVAAGIQALARSIQAEDDPERLFGERPRRRWKTGEMIQNSQHLVSAGRQPAAQPFN